uniref:Mitochondrial fission factor n=1 Tax=Periophthalmus magnuspinnatus TaxID=409849 RepID=A0A3B4AI77_9GOBI
MQVPDRIVVTGDNSKKTFSGTRDLDFIQSTPFDTLSLKTPPRVLTLSDRPLDFLEDEQRAAPDTDDTMRHQGRMRRERSASENMSVRPSGLTHNDSASPASSSSATTDPSNPCLTMADEEHNLYSASGVLSFIQSTTRRAYQQVLEVLDETSFDAGTDDLTMVDAATLRRQLIKLNRRLQLLEEENKERVKREMILYSITVAFWLVNTWVWLRR